MVYQHHVLILSTPCKSMDSLSFDMWHSGQSNCMFSISCLPPSDSCRIWSTVSSPFSACLHILQFPFCIPRNSFTIFLRSPFFPYQLLPYLARFLILYIFDMKLYAPQNVLRHVLIPMEFVFCNRNHVPQRVVSFVSFQVYELIPKLILRNVD